ncbi:hypothetical protein K493DRAFT_299352 [Basidiobolus meristosporus CBS 931.73]|uniref:Uncharacterized protein n=1 Tax=Basidiobolus meristosporus CBS 931.73 TaxID=1314790 RepID=A0A1Y1YN21_9FUNG|nr:hypothetical protein K493DRAFT_299352 [Basidiobolus meristosporus CBS 931.73]|eukprot:ORX99437.1 hypothetical protein K493DRAFT_299352 [Basidiobolus meristosporus CBS 931.73]
MKDTTLKMSITLIGLSSFFGHANSFSVVNSVKQQAFSMMDLSFPPLTQPTSHFADGIHNPSLKCQSAILVASQSYPNLNTCFSQMPLFFSTLDDVCKSECLQDTISGAKLVTENCDPPSLDSNSQRVYNSWANKDAATVACEEVDGSHCLSKVIRAGVALENNSVRRDPMPQEELKRAICLPCTEQFYKAVKKPGNEPVLYYYQIMDPQKLFTAFEEYCGYRAE